MLQLRGVVPRDGNLCVLVVIFILLAVEIGGVDGLVVGAETLRIDQPEIIFIDVSGMFATTFAATGDAWFVLFATGAVPRFEGSRCRRISGGGHADKTRDRKSVV